MKTVALALFSLLFACVPCAHAQGSALGDATLMRVFLVDTNSTLVSYGEIARVGDRAVFSMPVPQSDGPPLLQLVSIQAERVDWPKTDRYAESARASRYLSSRAAGDYAQLSSEVAQSLNDVQLTQDPAKRVEIAESARQRLAEWPAAHYNFNAAEVQQMLLFLDEVIGDLRVATGQSRFAFNLTAASAPVPIDEPLLPPPTLKEAIEQVLLAATFAETPVDRTALLTTAFHELERHVDALPADWAASTTGALRSEIAEAMQVELEYQLLSQRMVRAATEYARNADVRAIVTLQNDIELRDAAMGRKRPDMMAALHSSIIDRLEAAQQLRLARDHWAARLPDMRRYNVALAPAVERFGRLRGPLDDIRALAGTRPTTLALVTRLTTEIVQVMSKLKPPTELEAAHALMSSAVQLALNAASIRSEAVETGNINRAWDASSAATGALLLFSRASNEIQSALRQPQP